MGAALGEFVSFKSKLCGRQINLTCFTLDQEAEDAEACAEGWRPPCFPQ